MGPGDKGTLPPRDNRGQNFTGGGDTAANRNVLRLICHGEKLPGTGRINQPGGVPTSSFLFFSSLNDSPKPEYFWAGGAGGSWTPPVQCDHSSSSAGDAGILLTSKTRGKGCQSESSCPSSCRGHSHALCSLSLPKIAFPCCNTSLNPDLVDFCLSAGPI